MCPVSPYQHDFTDSILASLGCFKKILLTGWLKQLIFICMISETWRSKIKVLADSLPGEGLLPGLWTASYLLALSSQREHFVLSYKDSNSIMRVLPSWTDQDLFIFQRPHRLIPSHCGLRLQHMNLGGKWDIDIQSKQQRSEKTCTSSAPLLPSPTILF